jgi:acyl carrier protein
LTARIRVAVKRAWTTILDEPSFQADIQWDEAGGDSLAALQLWHMIESELGAKLPLEAVTKGLTRSKLIKGTSKNSSRQVATNLTR